MRKIMSIKTFIDPDTIQISEAEMQDAYDKCRVLNKKGFPIEKVPYKNISTNSYTWHQENTLKIHDNLDKNFISFPKEFKQRVFYSYSDHSAFPLIFRVMLSDIIKVAYEEGIFSCDKSQLYFNSYPCDQYGNISYSVYKNFDYDKDAHRVVTIVR